MAFTEIGADVASTRATAAAANVKGIPALAVRQDSDTIAEADGTFTTLRTNEEGRLKITSKPGTFPTVSQNFTAISQSMPVDVSRCSNATIHIRGGSVAGVGGNFVFEASLDSTNGTDGTWFGIQAVRTNANTVETSTGVIGLAINTGATYAWELSVNAYLWLRVRSTALTSGNYNVVVVRGVYATEPIPAVQTHAVTLSSGTTGIQKAEDAAHATGDIGVMSLGVRNDGLATTPASANGDYSFIAVDAQGAQFVRHRGAPTGTLTSVTAATASGTILAANVNRTIGTIYNDSTATLYLALAATASTTAFTFKLAPEDYFELPGGYSGIVTGIWSAVNGAARVTEVSA